jgi:hypothetical protein
MYEKPRTRSSGMSAENFDHLYEKPQAILSILVSLRFFVQARNGSQSPLWVFGMFSASFSTH